MSPIVPLDPTKYDLIDQQATKPEWVWRRVPIIGWMISTMLWERRNRPLFDEYCQVLDGRPEITPEAWGDEARQQIGIAISRAAHTEIGWPNDRLIPQDPIRVALWSFHDGLDAEEAIQHISKQLGVEINWDQLLPIWNSNLDALVDLILSLPKTT